MATKKGSKKAAKGNGKAAKAEEAKAPEQASETAKKPRVESEEAKARREAKKAETAVRVQELKVATMGRSEVRDVEKHPWAASCKNDRYYRECLAYWEQIDERKEQLGLSDDLGINDFYEVWFEKMPHVTESSCCAALRAKGFARGEAKPVTKQAKSGRRRSAKKSGKQAG